MHLEPAALDREFEARAVPCRAAAVAEQKRLVDFLDVDAPLNRLNGVRDLEDPARGFLWAGVAYCMRRPCLPCRPPRDDPDRIVGQSPLERLGPRPTARESRRRAPHLSTDRHGFRMNRVDDGVRRRREKSRRSDGGPGSVSISSRGRP
jgi:hypothetical protein